MKKIILLLMWPTLMSVTSFAQTATVTQLKDSLTKVRQFFGNQLNVLNSANLKLAKPVQLSVNGNAVIFSHPNINDNTVCVATLVEKYGGETVPVFSTGNGVASLSVFNTSEQESERFSANILIDL